MIPAMPGSAEIVHERLKAFLLFLKPFVLSDAIDQDRLAQLRRLSDVRIRKFAVDKPAITGTDLCGLLADPRVGRFDDLADEAGMLKKAHFAAVLPALGEDMGYLTEACLTLQVAGLAAMKGQAQGFVKQQGAVAAPAEAAVPKTSALPLPAPIAELLAAIPELWSLPPSTLKALTLLAAADSPPDAVCAELERDPAFAARLLRVVNAATTPKSGSIRRAVLALGYPLARRFAMTAALAAKLGSPYAEAGFDERAFWRGSLRTAYAAAQVSKAAKLGSPDEHFSAGLLHEIGRLAEAKAGGSVSTAAVGAAILERWRFPAAVVEAARHHTASVEQLEELQVPREAIVVVALHQLEQDRRAWAGFLRVGADLIPSILDAATKSADAGLVELLG
jgi:HD-like signal output (HDOD) protein